MAVMETISRQTKPKQFFRDKNYHSYSDAQLLRYKFVLSIDVVDKALQRPNILTFVFFQN